MPSSLKDYGGWGVYAPTFEPGTTNLSVFTNGFKDSADLFNKLQDCTSISSISINCSSDYNPFYELTRLEGKGITSFSTRYGQAVCDATGFKIPSTLVNLELFYTDNNVDTKDICFKVTNMPSNIVSPNGTALKTLKIKQTDINTTEWMEGLTNLQDVRLVGNKITKLVFNGTFPVLKTLDLTNNEISELKELEKLTSLTYLRMENNSITENAYINPSDESTKYCNLDVFAIMFDNGLRQLYINSSTNTFTSVEKINTLAWTGKNGF